MLKMHRPGVDYLMALTWAAGRLLSDHSPT
jgi:hypothetical protein